MSEIFRGKFRRRPKDLQHFVWSVDSVHVQRISVHLLRGTVTKSLTEVFSYLETGVYVKILFLYLSERPHRTSMDEQCHKVYQE